MLQSLASQGFAQASQRLRQQQLRRRRLEGVCCWQTRARERYASEYGAGSAGRQSPYRHPLAAASMTMLMQMDDASERCFALSLLVLVLALALVLPLLSACLDLGKTQTQGRRLEQALGLCFVYGRGRETAQQVGNPA